MNGVVGPLLRLLEERQDGSNLSLQRYLERVAATRLKLQQVAAAPDPDQAAGQTAAAPQASAPTHMAETQVQGGVQGNVQAAPVAPAASAASPMSQAAVQTMTDLGLQIQRRAAAGQSQFRVQLTPGDMGKVDVALTIGRDGQARAQLSFDNPQTTADFAGRLDELSDQLRQAGLNVAPEALSVRTTGDGLVKAAADAANAPLHADASQAASQSASQNASQSASQNTSQAAPASASNGHAASSSSSTPSSNLSGQEMAQNSNPQGQQARPNPQQAARRLQNASQLGAVDGETGLDGGVDAALSALRNRSTASRLALNLIV